MKINDHIYLDNLKPKITKFWELSARKIHSIEKNYDSKQGSPVFTVEGKYSTRGWTEWTQGFQYGSAALQFDATEDKEFLEMARKNTLEKMASHVSHFGVHDHGFNNISTYGNLLRLMHEGKIPQNDWEKHFYELALKISGAVQANRWTVTRDGGFIHSFNGAHSLFVDTIRTVRVLVVSHLLGHALMSENDLRVSLLERGILHSLATAKYAVYYGEGRDLYDVRGRTAHESIFNVADGNYRCPGTQQGYTGFSTWTRGLSWAILGFAEQLECLQILPEEDLVLWGGKQKLEAIYLNAAQATCDFYVNNSALDGIPYWDTGAPNLSKLGDYLPKPADPYNDSEPVDSSAAAIAAQGLLRLGKYLESKNSVEALKYWQGGLTILDTLLETPYLSYDENHQGLLLHSVYHHPNNWDFIPAGSKIPHSESSMWGDYHIRELVLYLDKILKKEPYYTFFNAIT